MNVLMINPEFPVTFWSFKRALTFTGKRCSFPPLGLMTVSAMLPPDWTRRLVDLNVTAQLDAADIAWADIVFVTGMLIQKQAVHRVIRQCKQAGKPVAVGGPYVSTSTEQVVEADYLFVGEAETTLPEFLKDLAAGETKSVYRADARPALSLTPVPDFSLVDMNVYATMSVQYSRGCPFDCEFCDITVIYGRVPRTKSSEQILAELDALKARGWRGSVFFVDDNFIGNIRDLRLFMPALVKWQKENHHPFSFFTEASVNLADHDELLALMREANFTAVFQGIETPEEASLIETNKRQNTKRSLLDAVRKIQSYGIQIMAGFIVGFDNDPADIFERQIAFIKASAIPLAMVGRLTALPDTKLWKRLQAGGRLLQESNGDNTSTNSSLNFVPIMDPEVLIGGHERIVKTIYQSREFYRRTLEMFRRLPPPVKSECRPESLRHQVRTLSKILYRLGLVDRDRHHFWSFTARALMRHPRRFANAMELAAMGYHCRTIATPD